MNKYSIGQVSKITGLSAKTIRFYEEKGLITSAKREKNGYRYFEEKDLDEIKIIRNTRDLGLPLSEIKKLIVGCENGSCEHTKDSIQKSIDGYLQILAEKIRQMEILKSRLKRLQGSGPYCCGILHQLSISTQEGGEK